MTEPFSIAILSATGLAGLAMMTTASLSGWRGWLALQQQSLMQSEVRHPDDVSGAPPAGARIELADLKERVRKLEAIAAGIDL